MSDQFGKKFQMQMLESTLVEISCFSSGVHLILVMLEEWPINFPISFSVAISKIITYDEFVMWLLNKIFHSKNKILGLQGLLLAASPRAPILSCFFGGL